MKKLLVVGMIILLVGMSIPSTGINVERTSTVSYDGKTLYVGGSGSGNYTRIQDAIDDSSSGDTVFVYNGTYYEHIVINVSISLIGENKHSTIIDGSKSGHVILVLNPIITIKDFTIQNSGTGCWYRGFELDNENNDIKSIYISECIIKLNSGGIRLNNASNISISNCWINNNSCSSVGIWAYSNNVSITDCSIDRNGEFLGGGWLHPGGIFLGSPDLYSRSNIIISGCEIKNIIGDGITAKRSNNLNILNNNIYNNTMYGISISSNCNQVEIHNNIIHYNYKDGVYISGAGTNLSNISIYNNTIINNMENGSFIQYVSNAVIMEGNIFSSNNLNGIYLLRSKYNFIRGNEIVLNEDNGIKFEESNSNTIIGNNFHSNKNDGIHLLYSHKNTITKNNFLNNSQDTYISLSFLNQWKQNYWNGPRLLPKLIFGRVGPFPWINVDWHPAKEPYDI